MESCPPTTSIFSSSNFPITVSTTLSLLPMSLSFPLFPLTDKKTLSDPKSHRKSHFMAVLFPLGGSLGSP